MPQTGSLIPHIERDTFQDHPGVLQAMDPAVLAHLRDNSAYIALFHTTLGCPPAMS